MATYTIIKLKDMSPLHMGTGKENYDFSASMLHSDTLSSALAAMRVQLGKRNDIYEFLDSFTLSSAFPYMNDMYFLPVPHGKINVEIEDCDEYISRKKIKKISFVETSIWKMLAEGKKVSTVTSNIQHGFLLPNDGLKKFDHPYQSSVVQRVSVPREDNLDATPFFFDWTYFQKNGGLYCITDAKGALLDEILSLFTILGEVGIGTDKNIGGGKFEVETDSISFPDIDETNEQMLLSLYIPSANELSLIDLNESHFNLILRGGYMAGSEVNDFWHLRKKNIYMFNVGSVLHTSECLKGKIVNLCPVDYKDSRMHPVYRSGKPFLIPIKKVDV